MFFTFVADFIIFPSFVILSRDPIQGTNHRYQFRFKYFVTLFFIVFSSPSMSLEFVINMLQIEIFITKIFESFLLFQVLIFLFLSELVVK